MMAGLHVLRVAERELRREPAGEMWCFACRKRLPHDAVVTAPSDPMSYYGPRWQYECSRCHRDYTSFPGTWREYHFQGDA